MNTTTRTRTLTTTDRRRREHAEMLIAYSNADAESRFNREQMQAVMLHVTTGMTPAQRAHALYNLGVRPVWTGGNTLSVLSLTGIEDRTVTINSDGTFTCDCPAGVSGYARCWHVWICELEEERHTRAFEALS